MIDKYIKEIHPLPESGRAEFDLSFASAEVEKRIRELFLIPQRYLRRRNEDKTIHSIHAHIVALDAFITRECLPIIGPGCANNEPSDSTGNVS